MKRKFENIKEDKPKQMRNGRQNDKLDQLVMHWAFKDDVLGASVGCKKTKDIFLNSLRINNCFFTNQFTFHRKNSFYKA